MRVLVSTCALVLVFFLILLVVSNVVGGRSQLSTLMKAYREFARGRGSGTTVRFFFY